jgi:hypothetical protein
VSGESREPGWYPDQNDPEFNRYWNGRAWTARRHPVGAALPSVAEEDDRVAAKPPAESAAPRRRIPIWMWVVGALMIARTVVGVVAAFDGPDAGTSTAVTSNPTSQGSTATPQMPGP